MSDLNEDYVSASEAFSQTGDATPDSEQSNPQPEQVEQEPTFDVDGNPLPFSKLSPDVVKQWYEAHTNKSKWQRENTRKAEEIAKSRKEWESKHPSYEQKLKEFEEYNSYLMKYPELRSKVEQAFRELKTVGPTQGQPTQPSADPQIMKEIQELKAWKEQLSAAEQKKAQDRQIEEAYATLTKSDPDFNRESFDKFKEDVLGAAGTDPETGLMSVQAVYSLLHDAMKARNIPQVKKDTERKTLQNIKDKKVAGIETGKGPSPKDLPDNIDISDKSVDDIFEEMKERKLYQK